jgi:hypothetical protein
MTTTTPPPQPVMLRKSWYLSAEAANGLNKLADDLHYAYRQPKSACLAAAVAVAIEHRAEIEARLTAPDPAAAPGRDVQAS